MRRRRRYATRDKALAAGATPQSLAERRKQGKSADQNGPEAPLLSSALAVTPRLVGIDLAHPLEEILRVRLLHVGGFGAAAFALLRAPRRGTHRSLSPFRHAETLGF